MAIALDEPAADACAAVLEAADELFISAATLAEARIVAARRNVGASMESLVGRLGLRVINVTARVSITVAQAYQQWGKGFHPAALNFGDCFAYAAAKEHDCPLLYVGNDFTQTDIKSALSAA